MTQVQKNLENEYIDVYVSQYSSPVGQSLTADIKAAIRRCDMLVLIWSDDSEASNWVNQEVGAAAGLDKVVLPMVLKKGLRPPAILGDLRYLEADTDPVMALSTLQKDVFEAALKKETDEKRRQEMMLKFALVVIVLLVVVLAYQASQEG